jgi:hypothetical protein
MRENSVPPYERELSSNSVSWAEAIQAPHSFLHFIHFLMMIRNSARAARVGLRRPCMDFHTSALTPTPNIQALSQSRLTWRGQRWGLLLTQSAFDQRPSGQIAAGKAAGFTAFHGTRSQRIFSESAGI